MRRIDNSPVRMKAIVFMSIYSETLSPGTLFFWLDIKLVLNTDCYRVDSTFVSRKALNGSPTYDISGFELD